MADLCVRSALHRSEATEFVCIIYRSQYVQTTEYSTCWLHSPSLLGGGRQVFQCTAHVFKPAVEKVLDTLCGLLQCTLRVDFLLGGDEHHLLGHPPLAWVLLVPVV